jgi:hypothetical protein
MIVTDHFVYIHTSRTAGTFLNKLILNHVSGARQIQYHGHLRDLPAEYTHLPVIGIVRNPWDWYVSMFFDYRRKQQYIFQLISGGGALRFEKAVARYLRLGDNSDKSRQLLQQLVHVAPKVIDDRTPPRRKNPGLLSEHFANFPADEGYYTWLFKLMFESDNHQQLHFGRFENLREEILRLFEETGTPISRDVSAYLGEAPALNPSQRPRLYFERFKPDLQELVAEKERYICDRFDYDYSMAKPGPKYPKANFYKDLGTVDTSALIARVKTIPEAVWVSENETKLNKYEPLNDTRHILFRFVEKNIDPYEFNDHPLWDEWKDLLLPILEQAAKRLGYTNYRFPRVMLARLPAGGEISTHSDDESSYYVHKIHVPLITNPETTFHVGIQARHMAVGEVIEVNNKRMHAVTNKGVLDRIHLIFECYNMDDYGKRG